MATAQSAIVDGEAGMASWMRIRLQPALCPTERQFYEFCGLNSELRIERNAQGEVTVMPPAGWNSARTNARITSRLDAWAVEDGTGETADSSAGYRLANGAIRSPDASWVTKDRLAEIPAEQRSRFLPLCPDFVVELLSPTDRVAVLRGKLTEYLANGTKLGWLIDPMRRRVLVYRPGSEVEELHEPEELNGDPVLPGFRLRMEDLWGDRSS